MRLYTFRSYTPGEGYGVETRWYSNDDIAYEHAAVIIKRHPATEEVEIFKSVKCIEFLPVGVLVNSRLERI